MLRHRRHNQLCVSALSKRVLELYRVGIPGFGGGGGSDAGAGASTGWRAFVALAVEAGPRTTGLLAAALGSVESNRASAAGGTVACIVFSSIVSKELYRVPNLTGAPPGRARPVGTAVAGCAALAECEGAGGAAFASGGGAEC